MTAARTAAAAQASMPCTNPAAGRAPVGYPISPAHWCTGIACPVISQTHRACRFGP